MTVHRSLAKRCAALIILLLASPSTAETSDSSTPECGPWFYYYQEQCVPLQVDERELRVVSREGTATPQDVLEALASAGESRFTLQDSVYWLFRLPDASEAPADLRSFRRPLSGSVDMRTLLSRWYWSPGFYRSQSPIGLNQEIDARFLPDTPRDVVADVIEQEVPGSSFAAMSPGRGTAGEESKWRHFSDS